MQFSHHVVIQLNNFDIYGKHSDDTANKKIVFNALTNQGNLQTLRSLAINVLYWLCLFSNFLNIVP